jgi:hypothetical protein
MLTGQSCHNVSISPTHRWREIAVSSFNFQPSATVDFKAIETEKMCLTVMGLFNIETNKISILNSKLLPTNSRSWTWGWYSKVVVYYWNRPSLLVKINPFLLDYIHLFVPEKPSGVTEMQEESKNSTTRGDHFSPGCH